MFGEGGASINQQPWLVLVPFVAILVLYASLNLVGFGLHGVRRGNRGVAEAITA
jgi:ABC-type dipeptide/oligopeptide/nickel transport system permease subunit